MADYCRLKLGAGQALEGMCIVLGSYSWPGRSGSMRRSSRTAVISVLRAFLSLYEWKNVAIHP